MFNFISKILSNMSKKSIREILDEEKEIVKRFKEEEEKRELDKKSLLSKVRDDHDQAVKEFASMINEDMMLLKEGKEKSEVIYRYLTEKKIKKLAKGYVVAIEVNKQRISLKKGRG